MFRTFFSSVFSYFYSKPCYTFTEHEKYNKVLNELQSKTLMNKTTIVESKKLSKAARIIRVSLRPVKEPKIIDSVMNTKLKQYYVHKFYINKKLCTPIHRKGFYLHQPQKFKI